MKKTVFVILVILVAIQTVGFSQKNEGRVNLTTDTLSGDKLEYKLVVLSPGFESWLLTQPPATFYSKEYYEHRNRLFVMEWNIRYMNSLNNGLNQLRPVNEQVKDNNTDLKSLVAQSPESNHSQEYTHRNRPAEPNTTYRIASEGLLYENPIDYDPKVDYGLDLNYRLYYYFLYFQQTNHVMLLGSAK